MMHALVLLPLVGGAISWLIGSNSRRPLVLPAVAIPHFAVSIFLVFTPARPLYGGWIMLDPLGGIVLITVSLLFMACAVYAVAYLRHYRRERSNRVLCSALLVCLAAMSMATVSQHMGLLWVAVETTTVTMAPLIYFNRNARSIEATWKYLLIGSVGIALALLGIYFLGYATLVAGHGGGLMVPQLVSMAETLDPLWLKFASVFMLVGFGTKMGLAPLHTWKPDAYGEAPGLVGALLSGGLTSVALLALLRVYQVVAAAGDADHFFHNALILMGLLSMAVGALFLARQSDIKRILAYSSVENIGIIAFALGLGKGAVYGALLHMAGNGLAKGVSFLASGNIHRSYASKSTYVITGVLRRLPWSGGIFLAAFLAISAFPPSLPFLSEFSIAAEAFRQGEPVYASLFLLLLAVVFLGVTPAILGMLLGPAPERIPLGNYRDRPLTVLPPIILLFMLLFLGLWIPAPLQSLFADAAAMLGGLE